MPTHRRGRKYQARKLCAILREYPAPEFNNPANPLELWKPSNEEVTAYLDRFFSNIDKKNKARRSASKAQAQVDKETTVSNTRTVSYREDSVTLNNRTTVSTEQRITTDKRSPTTNKPIVESGKLTVTTNHSLKIQVISDQKVNIPIKQHARGFSINYPLQTKGNSPTSSTEVNADVTDWSRGYFTEGYLAKREAREAKIKPSTIHFAAQLKAKLKNINLTTN